MTVERARAIIKVKCPLAEIGRRKVSRFLTKTILPRWVAAIPDEEERWILCYVPGTASFRKNDCIIRLAQSILDAENKKEKA